jgi:CYTH domain-containing protein
MSGEAGKYARFELERRFLLERIPDGVAGADGWAITDRYITGTRLRLRRMEPLRGGDAVLKLGQKDAPSPPDFSRLTITNLYLSAAEYDVLSALPAHELRKRRCRLVHDGRVYGVDEFDGELTGLILAEVGYETADELEAHTELPGFALRDVSDDVRFTGGALASTTQVELAALLARP